MGRTPKPDTQAPRNPIYPAPTPADYSGEVSKRQLKQLQKIAEESGEKLDTQDGPAW